LTDWTIRRAHRGDLRDLVALRLALQAHLERGNPSLWRLSPKGRVEAQAKFVDLMGNEDAMVLVATDADGHVAGMATGQILRQEERIPGIAASINTLFVVEAWRRQGIGKALVAKLCDFFAAKDAEEITLRYVIGNSEAERFWSRLGLEPRIITAGTSRQDLAARLAR